MSQLDVDALMPFGNREALFIFMADHAAAHTAYAQVLATKYNVQAPLFDLVDVGAAEDWATAMEQGENGRMTERIYAWLLAHDRLHQAELVALQLEATPVDLSNVDFRSADQFYDWMYDHIQLHDAEDLVL
jgi:hypothetical protein